MTAGYFFVSPAAVRPGITSLSLAEARRRASHLQGLAKGSAAEGQSQRRQLELLVVTRPTVEQQRPDESFVVRCPRRCGLVTIVIFVGTAAGVAYQGILR